MFNKKYAKVMIKIKEFKKKGCLSVTLGKSELLGFCVAIKERNEVKSMYSYDSMHEALEMFWYCVAHASGISKYVQ